jgi:hypothetical protein
MVRRSPEETPQRRAERQAQRARELQGIIDRLAGEVTALEAEHAACDDPYARWMIAAEIAHVASAIDRLQRGPRADPGLPAPATPPEGPQPDTDP